MKRDALIAFVIAAALATAAVAQKGSGSGSGSVSGSSGGHLPYAGLDKRQVASLSDEEMHGLLAGRGLGLALPAELNGYPGPMHVLEMAADLELTATQKSAIEALFGRMKTRAIEAGTRYVEAEKAVDALFRSGQAEATSLEQVLREADQRRAEKRLAHLDAHIEAAKILNATQRAKYAELRGYVPKN